MRALREFHGDAVNDISAYSLSKSYDCFLSLRRNVDLAINKVLGRTGKDNRLRRACSACFYSQSNEQPLKYQFLCAADGNFSLKRFKKSGATDKAVFDSSYFLSKDAVEKFVHAAQVRKKSGKKSRTAATQETEEEVREEVQGFADMEDAMLESGTTPDVGPSTAAKKKAATQASHETGIFPLPEEDDPLAKAFKGVVSDCVENWKANADDAKKSMWDCFDEAGIFVLLCRHGHILLVCDIVQSGEQ